jgi:Na+/melibiose symporter-like transporter
VGGILYEKAGIPGVFGMSGGMLALDFLMRVLIIEKKTAAQYSDFLPEDQPESDSETASEEDPLLPREEDDERFKIKVEPGPLLRTVPLLYCFRNPRLLTAFFLAFIQACIVGIFDATIPTESESLFNFTSLEAGLLYIALDVPYLVLGSAAGWIVDKYGPKPLAVIGFAYFVPALIVLRIPSEQLLPVKENIILYCALLALNGIGLAMISAPSIVEATEVVRRYDKANPGFFGANGPYAQLYGFSSVFFSGGLTVGPLLGGLLRDTIGYGNMNAVLAAISGMTAVLSLFALGGKMHISCFGSEPEEEAMD